MLEAASHVFTLRIYRSVPKPSNPWRRKAKGLWKCFITDDDRKGENEMKNSLAEMNKSLFRSVTVSTKVSVECDERLNS